MREMELETLEVLLDVNTEKVQASMEKFMPQIESMMSRFEQISGRTMGKTEKNLDIDKGATNFMKQLEKMNQHFEKTMANLEKTSKVFGDNVGSNFASGVRKARPKATKEIDAMVNEINAKMGQAKAAQEKIAYLKSQRQSASSAGDTGKVVKYDEQIARAQAQMSKFEAQAKGMANTIKREFDAVPSSLDTITKSMAQNEGQIESMRKRIKTLKAEYADQRRPVGSFSGGFKGYEDTPQSLKTSAEIQKQSTKMVKLISDNDRLQQEYAQTEDRANSLRKALAHINNTMSQSSIQTGSAANGAAQTGSGLKQSERAVSKYGGVFNRMSNAIYHGFGGIGKGMKSSLGYVGKFGSLFSSSSNKVTVGNKRMSRSNNTMVQSMRGLLRSMIVYHLIRRSVRLLARGLFRAMNANSQFASSLNQIKVNLLTAFYPIYTAIMPAINALMSALSQFTGQFASFMAGIFGMSYQQAKAGASGLYENVQALKDTGSSADEAKDKVKKLQKTLLGFDQINKLDTNVEDADSDKGNKKMSIDFGSALGDYSTPKWMLDIQKILKDFFKPFQLAWKNQGQHVISAWKYALTEVVGLSKVIGKSFMEVWTKGTGQRFVENLLILLADVLKIAGDIAKAFKNVWNENNRGKDLIQSIFNALNKVLELLHVIGQTFRDVWNDGVGESIAANLLEIFTNINNVVKNLAEQLKKAWEAGDNGKAIFEGILGVFDDISNRINDVTKSTEKWAEKLDFTPLLTSIKRLVESIHPFTDKIGEGLQWLYEQVLLPLAGFTIEDLLPAFFDTLSAALDALNSAIDAVKPLFTWLWDEFLKPIGEWTGGKIVEILKDVKDELSGLSDWIDDNQESVENFTIIVGSLATSFILVQGALTLYNVVAGIATGVTAALSGAFAFLTSPITLVVLAIAAVIAIGVLLWKNWDKIKEAAAKLGKWISEKWEGIKEATSKAWNNVKSWTSEKWESAKSTIVSKAKEIHDNVKEKWENIKSKTKTAWENISSKIGSQAEDAKSKASKAFSNLKSGMSTTFGNMKETASEAFGKITGWASGLGEKIGGGLKSGVRAVKNGAKAIFNGIVGVIGGAVNGVIKGINWVLDKVGAGGSKLSLWEVPAYATGTNNHPGGLALVNDGLGANYREAYRTPDGKTGIFPAKRNLMVNLPKGTSVLSGPKTAQMFDVPKYAGGIGDWFREKWNGVKEIASNIWSYATNPGKLLNLAISKFANLTNKFEPALSMAKGAIGTLAEGATSWFTGLFNKKHEEYQASQVSTHDGSVGGAGVYRYLYDIAQKAVARFSGMRITSGYREGDPYYHGRHQAIDIAYPSSMNYSSAYFAPANWVYERFPNQVAYVITQGMVRDRSGFSGTGAHGSWVGWPDNDHYDHLHITGFLGSKEVSTGERQTRGYISRYQQYLQDRNSPGFANGGLVLKDGMYRIGENNKKEMIIPLEKPQRAIELINQAIEYIGLDGFDGTMTVPSSFNESISTSISNAGFSENDKMNYTGGGMQDFTSTLASALMSAISSVGATPKQATNGDIIINVGGKEFGRIAVKEINKYHQQLGYTELEV